MNLISPLRCTLVIDSNILLKRNLHISGVLNRTQAGRYRPKRKQPQPLTYEMANPPHFIVARKSWNSWNTLDGWGFLSFTAVESAGGAWGPHFRTTPVNDAGVCKKEDRVGTALQTYKTATGQQKPH
ncbi:mitochondrial ribosomal protein S24 isoform X2 [Calliopsis andreniformis]|uniref:mitochondrial ribosomal protein S24 isoform X2 n=1 Tax=Calliopsis andreniformis TaxID=337506 RepID=UPI003FCEB22B